MEWLISGSGITWRFLQRELATPMHKKAQTGEGEARGSDRHREKDTKQRERKSCPDRGHDIIRVNKEYLGCISP